MLFAEVGGEEGGLMKVEKERVGGGQRGEGGRRNEGRIE